MLLARRGSTNNYNREEEMKVLIKTNSYTHNLEAKGIGNHIGTYWNFLHYDCFKQLGHEVTFYEKTEKLPQITNNCEGYDILLCRGYLSLRYENEFLVKTLKTFKGRKILYLEGGDEGDIGQYFDTIFIPELKSIEDKWRKKYPNKDIRPISWTSVDFNFMDKDIVNPYPDNKFRTIYTGIFTQRFLDNLIKLANMGESIVLGGIYYDGKICRGFTKEEKEKLPSNLQLFSNNGIFLFGGHFPYLKYADLAICFYAYSFEGGLSSKLIEYLNCGLPVICEDTVPNRYRVEQYNAGSIIKWDDFNSLYEGIQKEKKLKRDKNDIKNKARNIHNPTKISEEILK